MLEESDDDNDIRSALSMKQPCPSLGMKMGTRKSRTDRHRIPIFPIEYRISRKKMKSGKIREKSGEYCTESVEGFSGSYSQIPYFIRLIPSVFPDSEG
jgi:hypothetical protein